MFYCVSFTGNSKHCVPLPYSAKVRQTASAARRWLIALALAGYGATPLPGTDVDLTARNRRIAAAVLTRTKAVRRVVVGHSMGGLIALAVALDHPPDALVLYEPILHGVLDPAVPAEAAALAWDRKAIAGLAGGIAAGTPEAGVAGFVEAWNETPWRRLPAAARTQLVVAARTLDREAATLPGHAPSLAALARLATPALLLRGATSPDFSLLGAAHAARALPAGHLIDLPACGHIAPVTAAETVAAAIETYLTAHADV